LKFKSETDYIIEEIEIYDIMGKPVYKNSTTNNINNYSEKISDFSIGVYMLKFRINNNWIMKKFIVKS
jgi:uncharacterized protein YrrD